MSEEDNLESIAAGSAFGHMDYLGTSSSNCSSDDLRGDPLTLSQLNTPERPPNIGAKFLAGILKSTSPVAFRHDRAYKDVSENELFLLTTPSPIRSKRDVQVTDTPRFPTAPSPPCSPPASPPTIVPAPYTSPNTNNNNNNNDPAPIQTQNAPVRKRRSATQEYSAPPPLLPPPFGPPCPQVDNTKSPDGSTCNDQISKPAPPINSSYITASSVPSTDNHKHEQQISHNASSLSSSPLPSEEERHLMGIHYPSSSPSSAKLSPSSSLIIHNSPLPLAPPSPLAQPPTEPQTQSHHNYSANYSSISSSSIDSTAQRTLRQPPPLTPTLTSHPVDTRHATPVPLSSLPSQQPTQPSSDPSSVDWSRLNNTLRRNSFKTVNRIEGLMDTLFAVLASYETREQRLTEALQKSRQQQQVVPVESGKVEELTMKNQALLSECDRLQNRGQEVPHVKYNTALVKCGKLEKEYAELLRKSRLQGHAMKAKVKDFTRLQAQLDKLCKNEELLKQRSRQAVGQVLRKQQKSSLDVKILEVAQYYQRKIESIEGDNNTLTLQNRSLQLKLTECEDKLYIHKQVEAYYPSTAVQRTPSVIPPVNISRTVPEWFAENLKKELEEAVKARQMAEEEINRLRKLRTADSSDAQGQIRQLEIELQRLSHEVDTRPSHKEHSDLKAQLLDANHASHDLADSAGTREKIRRDREMYRLGLHHIEQFDRPTLSRLVQDTCVAASLSNPHNLPSAVARLHKSSSSKLQQLEAFAKDACSIVLDGGAVNTGRALKALTEWKRVWCECRCVDELFRRMHCLLGGRPGGFPHPPISVLGEAKGCAVVQTLGKDYVAYVNEVEQLVNIENNVYQNKQSYGEADKYLTMDPETVLSNVVKLFMKLFQVQSIQGCTSALNKLYSSMQAQQTFFKALCSLLDLDPSQTSFHQCERYLRQGLAARPADNNSTLHNIMNRMGFTSTDGLVEDLERVIKLAREHTAEHIVLKSIMTALNVETVQDVMPALEFMLRESLSSHEQQQKFVSSISTIK
eukprot:GHVQ01010823.1.p1 GENE.GHVQ01010823.1~~GHVQ01010823.1.p1  ORF type:complete len:1025 (-),score=205.15 GHVQ01010823.1:6609-9683(-)